MQFDEMQFDEKDDSYQGIASAMPPNGVKRAALAAGSPQPQRLKPICAACCDGMPEGMP
jgi:hypothetical protein